MVIFDYIFFRMTQFFFEKSGRRGVPSITILSLTQTFLIAIVINPVINLAISKNARELHYHRFGYLGAAIFLLLFSLNYRNYKDKYLKLRFRWKDETPAKRVVNGILVMLVVVLPVIIFSLQSKN
jgi:hypothetical protein